MTVGTELKTMIEELKTHRDELRVRIHLAKAEAKEEWQRLEREWERLLPRLEATRREAGRTTEDVSAALRLAMDDLRKGYQRIREHVYR